MSKGLFSFLIISIALFVSAFYYSNAIQEPFLNSLNYIKTSYHNSTQYVQESIDTHFFQAYKIEELEEKLLKFENNHLVLQELASELEDLYVENDSSFKTNPKVELVRTISYQTFGDLNKVWIDFPDYNDSKIYGLVYKELVAGIVVPNNKRALGLLNKDIKSSYAVYIGELQAPGIAHGNNSENILVKFIPTWFNINIGDEVTTSGLDEIFFKGLKVGRVLSVTSVQGYQNAVVKPYYESNDPGYFHIIRSLK